MGTGAGISLSTDCPSFPSSFRGSSPAQSFLMEVHWSQGPSKAQSLPSLPVHGGRQTQYFCGCMALDWQSRASLFSAKLTLQLLSTADTHTAALIPVFLPTCHLYPLLLQKALERSTVPARGSRCSANAKN